MSVADQFKGLPMEELIGAPLLAAANASGKLSMQTAEFIQDVGVNAETGELNAVGFSYKKVETQSDGTEKSVDKTIKVPTLAIVNIPNLQVKEVNVDFEMEVKQQTSSSSKISTEVKTEAKYSAWYSPFSAKITATVAGSKESQRSTDNSAKYTVKVIARDDGMPEGLSKVLQMLSNIIVETDESATPADTEEV